MERVGKSLWYSLTIIFEKVIKNRILPILSRNMTQFQTGGAKGKGVVDNLFILRDIIDHSVYLNKPTLVTFYDTEKCFDSLWLEDCINSLWGNGVQDDTIYLSVECQSLCNSEHNLW